MGERRSYPRIGVSGSVLYSKDICPRLTVGSTVDLSMGGTKIESLYSLAKGERLEMSIAIGPKAIRCRGKVIYVLQPESGKTPRTVRARQTLSEAVSLPRHGAGGLA